MPLREFSRVHIHNNKYGMVSAECWAHRPTRAVGPAAVVADKDQSNEPARIDTQ
jgi:hypothetical protein